MRVVGARRFFRYGSQSGDAGCFLARAFHASVQPAAGTSEHLKIAFFFRESYKGERRAKRTLAAEGFAGDAQELAQRRQRVVQEMSAYHFESRSRDA